MNAKYDHGHSALVLLRSDLRNFCQNTMGGELKSDFDIFDTFAEIPTKLECNHHNKEKFRGISICVDCGQEFPDDFDAEKEYRFIKINGGTGRQIRRVYDKSIYKAKNRIWFLFWF